MRLRGKDAIEIYLPILPALAGPGFSGGMQVVKTTDSASRNILSFVGHHFVWLCINGNGTIELRRDMYLVRSRRTVLSRQDGTSDAQNVGYLNVVVVSQFNADSAIFYPLYSSIV